MTAQQVAYATHDWTSVFAVPPLVEGWVDVKKPGNGLQYAVGTSMVRDTNPPTFFSAESISLAGGLTPFFLPGFGQRQVVVLQASRHVANSTTPAQSIVWQRYFHGTTMPNVHTRACVARGISVWPAATDFDTRIAICGETYDEQLPASSTTPNTQASTTNPAGFIAVFNGLGALLWTHLAFDSHVSGWASAITDLSIRVEMQGTTPVDVVTYCGISTHDTVGTGTMSTLSPVLPFTAMVPSSDGATPQASPVRQWDGIVGRVIKGTGLPQVVFHSIVSGPEQDGMFGIAEIDENKFVVVGSTQRITAGPAPSGFEFPGINGGFAGPYYLGVSMTFDAFPTRTGGALVLQDVNFLGDPASNSYTHLRDVVVLRDWVPPLHSVAVVGSTNSATALASFGSNVSNPFQGGTDGLIGVYLHPLFGLTPQCARFCGGPGNDGFTGVQGWNEFPDHTVAAGFTDSFGPSGKDIWVESFFVDGRGFATAATTLTSIREGGIGGTGTEAPAVVGATNATTSAAGVAFNTGPLDDAVGGGIAVDERTRVDVVGQTMSMDFPASPNGRPWDSGADAVRVAFDMLPVGVGRTDGTGEPVHVLPPGFSGGTTPRCALSPFGKQILQAPPVVSRVLIDYMGREPAQGVTGSSILISRPSMVAGSMANLVFAGFQYGFPNSYTPAVLLPNGIESWITDNPVIYPTAFLVQSEPWVEALLPLPSPPVVGMPLTVQMFFWIPPNATTGPVVPSGMGPGPCTFFDENVATPALWMHL